MRETGAVRLPPDKYRFRVWAPFSKSVQVHVLAPLERLIPMRPDANGYHSVTVENMLPGALYRYRLDSGEEFPDPASRSQPNGVHGASETIDPEFGWSDRHWSGLPIEKYILYELHVGTFTPEGTFDAIIPHLDELASLGISAIELMPLAQFPGTRNWGYDGVFPFAVQHSYGGPAGLQRFVDACHRRRLAVVLDVVYNHLGPEGNYLPQFAPYFTTRYKTPWGDAINFDGPHSDEVRDFFLQNAIYWIRHFHIDALRLDAVHAIMDQSAVSFLRELAETVRDEAAALDRRVYAIAESALNDVRLIQPPELGGYGLDGQWNDDFHHALHTLLTSERDGYYVDFGTLSQMAAAFSDGFVYSGQYSRTRGRRHGNSSREIAASKFVVYAQNHDQIGNRMMGERLSRLAPFEAYKLAQAAVLLSPFIPLIFMGDEYGEPAPFQYFVSHSDAALIEAVRAGRKHEFANFAWSGEPPDPQDEATFDRCRPDRSLRHHGRNRILWEYHRELLRLRQAVAALGRLSKEGMDVSLLSATQTLMVHRRHGDSAALLVLNFDGAAATVEAPLPQGSWRKIFDSADSRWDGPGAAAPGILANGGQGLPAAAPRSAVLFVKEIED